MTESVFLSRGPWTLQPEDDDPSASHDLEVETEKSIIDVLEEAISRADDGDPPTLLRSKHVAFIKKMMGYEKPLPVQFTGLDSSRTWIIYWGLHSLAILGEPIPQDLSDKCIKTLASFQNETGGFGSGRGQVSHLATTYSAVCSLAYLGPEAFRMVNREKMLDFLMSVKQEDGSFKMHSYGEIDVRGCYCALSSALLLNILTPELCRGVCEYISHCQTYEGGIAASASTFPPFYSPQGEAHGGYTFCGLAAYLIAALVEPPMSGMRKKGKLDFDALEVWASMMQGDAANAGGFRGRYNKLVDGCYSWWCGSLFCLLGTPYSEEKSEKNPNVAAGNASFNAAALQQYIIVVAQDFKSGGLRDKPKKPADLYHTCYNLSGLSSSEMNYYVDAGLLGEHKSTPSLISVVDFAKKSTSGLTEKERRHWLLGHVQPTVDSESEIRVTPLNPVVNICLEPLSSMVEYFYNDSR